MKLRVFDKADYDTLIQWIDSEKLNYQWGGPNFAFPLDHHQLSSHCAKPEILPFILVSGSLRVGYVELFKVTESNFRICRVFVSSNFRGQGISKIMLTQLIELSRTRYFATQLSLAVFAHNRVARRCYEALGFNVTSRETGTRSYDGVVWDLLRMEKQL